MRWLVRKCFFHKLTFDQSSDMVKGFYGYQWRDPRYKEQKLNIFKAELQIFFF